MLILSLETLRLKNNIPENILLEKSAETSENYISYLKK